jgi:hypothetical protein
MRLPQMWQGQSTWNILKSWLLPDAWKTPVFNGTATHYEAAGGFSPVGYRINGVGKVQLRGLIKTTSAFPLGFVFFVLPVGFRPPKQELFGCRAVVDGGAETSVRVDVAANGSVSATFGSNIALTWLSLSQISFYTD